MADEAQIRSSLQIDVGNLSYSSKPTSFTADVSTALGPVPGAFSVSTAGVDVDLTELTVPGLVVVRNLDPTNYVSYGAWDTANYFPIGELLPGEGFTWRLARDIEGGANLFRFKADTAACVVTVEAFEK